MSSQRSAVPRLDEIDFQRQVVQLATILGWEHVHFRPAMTKRGWRTAGSGTLAKGWPDLLLVRPRDSRLIFAELKAEGAKPTLEQVVVLAVLRSLVSGATAATKIGVFLWHPSDFERIEAVLR